MHDIEQLDALGRSKGLVIYAIHQANAGWGVQWYEGGSPLNPDWRNRISVYAYYPTIAGMVAAETKRVRDWKVVG